MAIVREIKKRSKSIICYINNLEKGNNCFPFFISAHELCIYEKKLIVEMKQAGCNEIDKSMNKIGGI